MRATLYRGLFFGVSVFVFAALVWSVARADVLQGKVRITGDQMPLVVVDHEPNRKSGIWLNGTEFALASRDETSVQGTRTIDTGHGQVYEQLSVMMDPMIVNRFKANPRQASMEFGFVNYTEAQFPPGANAVLIWTRNQVNQLHNFVNSFVLTHSLEEEEFSQ